MPPSYGGRGIGLCFTLSMRPVPRELAALRLEAEQALRDDDWASLLKLAQRLRSEDREWWPHLWAPCAAIAQESTGGDGVPLLEEAIAGGFRQPDMLPLSPRFEQHPDWPRLHRLMLSPAAAPRLALSAWPTVTYGPELVLDALSAEEAALLRRRLPEAQDSAWSTAQALLRWATTKWEHANDHDDSHSALEVLDRAEAGERFACVEYSTVLTQALNAVAIPARRISLLMRDAHVGFGRGHEVSEAWIDDLDRWVVLDGQNGSWWGTRDDPLGWDELSAAFRAGRPRPDVVETERTVDEPEAWWRYFDTAVATGLMWGEVAVPLLQGEPITARVLAGPDVAHHPDLSQLATGLADAGPGPAVTFHPVHPYARAVCVGDDMCDIGAPIALEKLPRGADGIPVATVTDFGRLRDHVLEVIRP